MYGETSPPHLAVRVLGAAGAVAHPSWLSLHVMLRKTYSVVAFAIVGFTLTGALPPARRGIGWIGLAVACYSGVIELGQAAHGYAETPFSRAFDVLCGFAGGAAGSAALRSLKRRAARR